MAGYRGFSTFFPLTSLFAHHFLSLVSFLPFVFVFSCLFVLYTGNTTLVAIGCKCCCCRCSGTYTCLSLCSESGCSAMFSHYTSCAWYVYYLHCKYYSSLVLIVASGQNWEAAQQSPSIQQTSEVYLNGRCGDSQHSSDSEFY